MPIQFDCSCGTTLRVADDKAGKLVACPKCQNTLHAPLAMEIPSPPPLPVHDPYAVTGVAPAPPEPRRSTPPPLPVQQPGAATHDPPGQDNHELFHRHHDPELADFFKPAPREIGKLRSAHTSLLTTTNPKSLQVRLLIGVLVGGGIAAIVAICVLLFGKATVLAGAVTFFLLALIVTPIAVALSLYFTRFSYFCAYIGEHGVAFFRCSGSRERVTVRDVFRFDDADDLRVTSVRNYVNGAYTGTNYDYNWTDSWGRRVYRIHGTYQAENKLPARHDKFLVAMVAQEAWSVHLLGRILPALRAGEIYRFRLKGDNGIDVHKDYLELHMKGRVQRFEPRDLMEVRIKDGTIALKEPGAREGWFTSSGVHYFSFAELANAQIFLMLMEQMYGIAIGSR